MGGYTKKKGKLLISHRYDHIPLLDSSPGESVGAGRIRLTPAQKYEFFVSLQEKGTICDFVAVFREPDAEKAAWMCLGGRCGES